MQEMFYLMSYFKFKGLGKVCVLVIDGCFLGGSSGLSIGYVLFEVVEGGIIGLVEMGDFIEIDILNCIIYFVVLDVEFVVCCQKCEEEGWYFVEFWFCKIIVVLCVYVFMMMSVLWGVVWNI